MIEFRALGSLAVVADGSEVTVGGPRQRRLLAMLLIHRNSVVSVDKLADAVFAGEPTEAARTTMRSYIARIRKVIGDDTADVALLTQAPGYSLRVAPDVLDVSRFETLLADAHRQLSGGDAGLAATTVASALDMWRGDAYAEFGAEEWAQPEAQRLAELRVIADERLVEAEMACGRSGDVIARLENLIAEHPLRESFRAQLMLALYRSGRQVDALRAYRDYRSTLADEVGIDPSPSLAELEHRILDHDPTLELTQTAGEPLRGYRLGARLGVGPNGTIHLARVPGVEHDVSLSILRDPRVDGVEFIRSFDSNANRLASLRHPCVVALHDYWREPGTAYLVARVPLGSSLRDRLQRAPMTRAEISTVLRDVGGALADASSRGVAHGWITLDNIVVGEHRAMVTNFVVCPAGPNTDVDDFAAVVRAVLDRCDRPWSRPERASIDSVLDTALDTATDTATDTALGGAPANGSNGRRTAIEQLVERLNALLSGSDTSEPAERPNPFKGLRAFDESDAAEFFGRDDLVEALVERVGTERLTLVVGGSGSGKSSVIRAGLLPRVKRGDVPGSATWFVTTMMPGSTPFKELGESLQRVAVGEFTDLAGQLHSGALSLEGAVRLALPADARLMLVVDQFEELFTLAGDEEQREFLDLLADTIEAADGRVHVVATLRADFYDRPLAYQRFGALAAEWTVAIPAMPPAGIEAAVVGPLTAIGASAESALVAELVAAVVDQPSALPSLQFTLYELAARRDDRCLTLADYHELGGVDEAIAGRAEYLYRTLERSGQDIVRRVFEQLVTVGVDSEPTGRRRARADLAVGADAAAVQVMIDHWMSARLLTGDHDPRTRVPTVQIAHEAILASWPRLRQWIDDDRQTIQTLEHLRTASAEWLDGDRDDNLLYRGARLEAALDIVDGSADVVPPDDQAFLTASADHRDREERETARRIERQARANRRLRVQLGVIAGALVLALGVGFLAIDQRSDAQTERDAADSARRDATARELASAADANVDIDPERAIHLALLAVDETRSVDGSVLPQAVDALHRAVTSSRVLVNVPDTGGRLDWSPTDDIFVTEGGEETGMIDIRNAETGDTVLEFRGDDVDVNEVAFSTDGTQLAVAGDDGSLEVYDPTTGQMLATVVGSGPAWDPSFNADGTMLMSNWSDENVLRLTDLTTGDEVGQYPAEVSGAQLSPDGATTLVMILGSPFGALYDTATATERLALQGLESQVIEARWSPDGRWIATAGYDGRVSVFDASTGALAAKVTHDSSVAGVAWSRDGSRLASGSYDGTARVWDFDNASLVEAFRFQAQDFASGVPGVAFSPSGDRLAVSDWDITSAKIFDLAATGGGELASFQVDGYINATEYTADGELLSVTPDGLIFFADPSTGEVSRTLDDPVVGWPGVQLSPDGETMAVHPDSGDELSLVDVATGEMTGSVDLADDPYPEAMTWSSDGELLALSRSTNDYTDAEVIVANRSGERLASFRIPGNYLQSLAFSPDGSRLATTRSYRVRADPERDTVQIWDWRAGAVVAELPTKASEVVFDPSGRYLATSRVNEGEVDIWDAKTLTPISTLSGTSGAVSSIDFAADGGLVATGGNDRTVRIWDPVTGLEQSRFLASFEVTTVAFSPDGETLTSVDASGSARVWTLDLDELISIAQDRLTRDLTDAECRQYLHTDTCRDT